MQRTGWKRMTRFHTKVMKSTSNFHRQVRKARFGIAKDILDNATTLDTSDDIFNQNSHTRDKAIEPLVGETQLLALWFFLGWKVRVPGGSYP